VFLFSASPLLLYLIWSVMATAHLADCRSEGHLERPSTAAGEMELYTDDSCADSVFIQLSSNNNCICEACDVCQPRVDLATHRFSPQLIDKVRRLKDNPAFDVADQWARLDALTEEPTPSRECRHIRHPEQRTLIARMPLRHRHRWSRHRVRTVNFPQHAYVTRATKSASI